MRSDSALPRRALRAAIVAALVSLGACSAPKSFVVVSMRSAETPPIKGVTEVRVTVKQGTTLLANLTYPPPSGMADITIDQVTKNDLSVSFSGARSGTVSLDFDLRKSTGCTIGKGSTTAVIKQGNVAITSVDIYAFPCVFLDGGTPTPTEGGVFQGCDPVAPLCGGGKTCQVNCDTQMGECITGGKGAHGTPCTKNDSCMPGTQCFDYSAAGCGVKLCLRFCDGDNLCQAVSSSDGGAGDGGGAEVGGGAAVGTRSVCAGPVQCSGVVTGYHTCTFACDPRLTSIAASGCPAGLSCLVVGNMDQVDCACAEKSRTGTDGVDCTTSAQCAAGYICNMMGGSQKCRAVCRCDANGAACTAPNDCTGGRTCTALTNDTTFGACL